MTPYVTAQRRGFVKNLSTTEFPLDHRNDVTVLTDFEGTWWAG
jgi:hypothetical protein